MLWVGSRVTLVRFRVHFERKNTFHREIGGPGYAARYSSYVVVVARVRPANGITGGHDCREFNRVVQLVVNVELQEVSG